MAKTYNTPKRTHIVKTRLDDEEHAEFMRQLHIYGMSQAEFIREAISGATIKPTIVATLVSDDLLAAVGKLTAEYGRIGNNLNQIARHLNEWRSPYPVIAKELQDAAAELATLKFEVMKKVGDERHGFQLSHAVFGKPIRFEQRKPHPQGANCSCPSKSVSPHP